jgi:hypothetical protein
MEWNARTVIACVAPKTLARGKASSKGKSLFSSDFALAKTSFKA